MATTRSQHHLMGEPTLWQRALVVGVLVVVLLPVVYRLSAGSGRSAAQGDQIVLRYMAWGNPQQLDVEREIIRRFNTRNAAAGKPVRVELFMPPAGGYVQKLRLMLASGTAPDVMRVDHYDFPSLVPKGYFRPVDDLCSSDPTFDLRAFDDAAMAENYYRGKLYGLNVMFGAVICFYNKDLFKRAGLADPYELWKQNKWTWEAFEEAARQLTVRDDAGKTTSYGFLMPGGPGGPPAWAWSLWVWRRGGEILSPDQSRCLLDSPPALRGLQDMHDLLYRVKASPTPADTAASAFTFESGNVAMEFGYTGFTPRYRDNIRDFEWDIVPTPYDPSKPYAMVKGNQLVMSARCPHPKEAWAWITFFTSQETELTLNGEELRRAMPTRKAVLQGQEYLGSKPGRPPHNTGTFPAALDHPRELPIDATWPAWTTVAQKFLSSFFLDPDARAERSIPVMTKAINLELTRERQRLQRYLDVEADHGR